MSESFRNSSKHIQKGYLASWCTARFQLFVSLLFQAALWMGCPLKRGRGLKKPGLWQKTLITNVKSDRPLSTTGARSQGNLCAFHIQVYAAQRGVLLYMTQCMNIKMCAATSKNSTACEETVSGPIAGSCVILLTYELTAGRPDLQIKARVVAKAKAKMEKGRERMAKTAKEKKVQANGRRALDGNIQLVFGFLVCLVRVPPPKWP